MDEFWSECRKNFRKDDSKRTNLEKEFGKNLNGTNLNRDKLKDSELGKTFGVNYEQIFRNSKAIPLKFPAYIGDYLQLFEQVLIEFDQKYLVKIKLNHLL